MINHTINSEMIKICENNIILNKKRKLDSNGIIPPWREEIVLFIDQFKKIIIHNIYIENTCNRIKAEKIINCTNFFDILDDLPVVMPLIYTIVKNNNGIKRYIVYITILFLYYGLILFDQTHNYLYTSDIKRYFKIDDEDFIKISNLIIEISCSDKEYASNIRKKLFYINN